MCCKHAHSAVKRSSFYHLLLTLGVFLLSIIYRPLESLAISEVPSDSARDCNEAERLYAEGLALADNSDQEEQLYFRAIELCPDFSEAHNKLGELYKSRGEYDLAINEFTLASRRWHFVEPLISLGEIYRMQGHYDLAAKQLIEAVRIQPDSREAWNQLKYIRKRLGEYDSFSVTPPEPSPLAIFTRVPGMTLPKGTWVVDLAYNYWQERSLLTRDLILSTGRPFLRLGATQREREVYLWILGLGYGLTDNFTIEMRPRYSIRSTQFQGSTPQVSGLGDTNLLMKYHLWGQRRTHISLFHSLGIPTGDENASDLADNPGNPSPVGPPETTAFNIPLGSGTYSYTPGIAITMGNKPVTIQTNISYLFSDSTRVADEFRWDLAFIFPKFHDFETMLELNYRRTETLTGQRLLSDVVLKEPGGQTLFFSPGVQISLPQRYRLELGFQYPVIRPPDEVWLETTVFHLGLTKFFFGF